MIVFARSSVYGSGTIGIVALMCEKTIGIVDGGGCAGGRADDGQWAGARDKGAVKYFRNCHVSFRL